MTILGLFWTFKVGEISFQYSWTTGIKKNSEILSQIKGQIAGLAQIDIFSDFLVLGVANFKINYLRQFSFNFEKFCAHLAANFLNFPKHPQLFTFWWFWRKVWPNIRKLRNQKICQFEPTLISSLFSGSNISTFFSSICPKSTKVKNRPYLTVKRAQKHKENSI